MKLSYLSRRPWVLGLLRSVPRVSSPCPQQLQSFAQVAATRRLATTTAPRMTFPGPKQISGLVSSPLVLLHDRCQMGRGGGAVGLEQQRVTAGTGSGCGLQEERGGPGSPCF